MATPIGKLVGDRLSEARKTHGLTQDQVARHARHVGLTWSQADVAKLKSGTRGLSVGELLLLPLLAAVAFDDTSGFAFWFNDPEQRIALTDDATVTAGTLLATLPHPDVTLEQWDVPIVRNVETISRNANRVVENARERATAIKEQFHLKMGWFQLAIRLEEAERSEAERKAARSLNTTTDQVTGAAIKLWGMPLTAKRDAQVEATEDARSLQARRGHVTRELLAELRQLLTEG